MKLYDELANWWQLFSPVEEYGSAEDENRSMRWLMWTLEANADETVYAVHFAFLLKENDVVSVEHDNHTEGLFARADWLRMFEQVGFEKPEIIVDLYDREVFVARKPEERLTGRSHPARLRANRRH